MALPRITLYIGLDKDAVIEGPTGWDWASYDDVRFDCTGLGISLLLSTGSAAMESINSNKDLKIHFLAAMTSGKIPTQYDYQIEVKIGTKWFDSGGGIGRIALKRQA